MPIAIELRTTCESCGDPLPVNAFATRIPCWSCLHDNPLTPEHWAQLLGTALEDAWSRDEGEGVTENLKVGKRRFELRWSPEKRPGGARRPRPKEMRAELFPGVVGLAGEETDTPPTRENVAFQCTQCGGALSIDGRSRQIDCTYCLATTQLSDEAWRRIHPLHAQKRWYLVLEDDGEALPVAPKEAPTAPPFRALDLIVGPDGLIYGLVEIDHEKRALVCLDGDLAIRWRTDLKGRTKGFDRVAVVGDEVWHADTGRHTLRRYARADGKERGKLGESEPAGATVHHFDVKGASDLVGCADGTVLLLVAHRLVRYKSDGTGVLTWPPAGGLWGWWNAEKLLPLYAGELYEPELDDLPMVYRPTTSERRGGIESDIGKDRPLWVNTVQTRAVGAADGSLWLYDGKQVARYGPDGKCRWTVAVNGEAGLTVRPGLDGDLNAYVFAMDNRDRCLLHRITPDGKATRLADDGVGWASALAVTPEGRVTLFGNNPGELRVFDRDGNRLRASAAAVESERNAAEWEPDDEDEDDE